MADYPELDRLRAEFRRGALAAARTLAAEGDELAAAQISALEQWDRDVLLVAVLDAEERDGT